MKTETRLDTNGLTITIKEKEKHSVEDLKQHLIEVLMKQECYNTSEVEIIKVLLENKKNFTSVVDLAKEIDNNEKKTTKSPYFRHCQDVWFDGCLCEHQMENESKSKFNVNIITENTGEYKRVSLDEIIKLLEEKDIKELKILF